MREKETKKEKKEGEGERERKTRENKCPQKEVKTSQHPFEIRSIPMPDSPVPVLVPPVTQV